MSAQTAGARTVLCNIPLFPSKVLLQIRPRKATNKINVMHVHMDVKNA